MSEVKLTNRGVRLLLDWLNACRELGWRKEDMPALSDLWLKYHDENGGLLR